MPGTTMIGDCRYHGPTGSVLPPDARQAKRLLKSLRSLKISARALIDAANMVDVYLPSEQEADGGTFDPVMAALAASRARRGSGDTATAAAAAFAPPSAHYTDHHKCAIRVATETLRRLLRETLDSIMAADANTIEQYGNRKGLIEERMGLALHLAVDRAVDVGMAELAKEAEGHGGDDTIEEGDDTEKKRPASDDKKSKKKKKKRRRCSDYDGSGEEDDDIASRASNPRFDTTSEDRDRTFAFRRTASLCLESLSLQVMARTTVTWGKKKMYEVYKLPRPLRPVGGEAGVLAVRSAVEKEFRAIFRGGGEDQCGIRVYGLLRKIAGANLEDGIEENHHEGEDEKKNDDTETYLFIHMCIGKPLDLHDENLRAPSGEKRKKKANEFIAILRPGSTLFALSASRAPSGSRFTRFILPALARALSSTSGISADQTLSSERVGDISGTEPLDLLRSASSYVDGSAVGRYSNYAGEVDGVPCVTGGKSSSDPFATNSGTAYDPLIEINQVSTGTLLSRAGEQKRLETAGQHGQTVSNLATNISGTSNGSSSLIAANQLGLIVDHGAASGRAKKRDGDVDFGREGACPRLDRVCWKWSGTTRAASMCWEDEDDVFQMDNDTQLEETGTTGTKFKCGIVMEGSDVFGGLRALVASGIAKAPLPNYVRDAATTGTKTITVADGAFGAADSLAAV